VAKLKRIWNDVNKSKYFCRN